MSKRGHLTKSFGYAFTGIREAFQNEPNFRIHTFVAILTLTAAVILRFNRIEWLLLAFTVFFVLISELINTVLEAIVDIASPQISKKARVAKDVSAAAVLLSAIMAALVGLILFTPKVLLLLK